MSRFRFISCITALAACLTAVALVAKEHGTSRPIAITNVRIFDGERIIPDGTVVISGRTIEHVGQKDKIPVDADIIDGAGATLMPGLIDSHAHDWGYGVGRAPIFGVTTELEMFGDAGVARFLDGMEAQNGAPGYASLITAGTMATAPGGHGTQYGLPIPTLTAPADAQPWVDGRLAEGSDFVKIVLEDGSPFGYKTPFNTLDRATFSAVVDAAHRRNKLAVSHVTEQSYAKLAIEENVDGLVHVFLDEPPSPDVVALAAKRKIFVAPTLTVAESATAVASGKSLTEDPRLAPYLTAEEIDNLRSAFPNKGGLVLGNAVAAVGALHAAGVPILAGTDAPNPGTAWGVSMHRELEMLVAAGLTPIEALRAATSVPADSFRVKDRGRIAKGLRADLVLVNGNPAADITATRDILRVWKLGIEVDRTPVGGASSVAMKRALEAGRAHDVH